VHEAFIQAFGKWNDILYLLKYFKYFISQPLRLQAPWMTALRSPCKLSSEDLIHWSVSGNYCALSYSFASLLVISKTLQEMATLATSATSPNRGKPKTGPSDALRPHRRARATPVHANPLATSVYPHYPTCTESQESLDTRAHVKSQFWTGLRNPDKTQHCSKAQAQNVSGLNGPISHLPEYCLLL